MKSVAKNVVVIAALAGACGVVAVHRARSLLDGEGRWTDGGTRALVLPARGAEWSEPVAVAGGEAFTSALARPALSPDGRWIAFADGELGLNCDLFVAPVTGDRIGEAVRIDAVVSTADELAPSFGGGALWFASNREGGAGGFDLYRAAFDGETFGAPERLAGALQSTADDLDPAFDAASGEIVFASTRDGALRLYVAREHASGGFDVRALDVPEELAQAREPALSPSGALLYVSARDGASFDVWRASRRGGEWSDFVRVTELASGADERAPSLGRSDFELTFVRDGLLRAHSHELVRAAPRAMTVRQILLIAALLLLALVAKLSERWPGLETIYKCLLVSLLAHLLLLWWFQRVQLAQAPSAKPEGGSTPIRVRIESPSTLVDGSVERAGEIATARASTAARALRPERAELVAPSALPSANASPASAPTLASVPDVAPDGPVRGAAEREVVVTAPTDVLADVERVASAWTADSASSELEASQAARAERASVAAVPPSFVETPGASERASASAAVAPSVAAAPDAESLRARPVERAEWPQASSGASSTSRTELADRERVERAWEDRASRTAAEELAPAESARTERAGAPAPSVAGPMALPAASERAQAGTSRPGANSAPRIAAANDGGIDAASPERTSLSLESHDAAHDSAPLALEDRERLDRPATANAPASATDAWLDDLAPSSAPRSSSSAGVEPGPLAPAPATSEPLLAAPAASAPLVVDAERPRDDERAPKRRDGWENSPYQNRSGAAKDTALREHGGDERTEAAVERGLAYLASVQTRQGGWGPANARDPKYGQVAIGKTALCTLAFLGAGHTHLSGTRHSQVVLKALAFLLASQDARNGHFGAGEAYGHGIATYALAEAFALTKDEALAEALRPAVARVLAQQSRDADPDLDGGWTYYYADTRRFDRWSRTSITSWHVMALESARLGGLEVPSEAFEAAARFLERSFDPDLAAYRYSHDPERLASGYPTLPASTPSALFALALLGRDLREARFGVGKAFVVDRAPRSFAFESEAAFVARGQGNPYFVYQGTLAAFRVGGGAWETWNAGLKSALLPAQESDGSWRPIDVYARYAKDSDRDRSYTTALCVLSLEVYYRYYLPLLTVRRGEERVSSSPDERGG